VAENYDPVLLDDGLQPFSLGFESLQRVKVVGHDPRERKMMTGWEKVGDEENGFAAAGEFDGLDIGVVPGNTDCRNTGKNFGIASEGMPLAGLLHREKSFFEVASAIAFGGVGGVSDFRGLNDVFGVGKSGDGFVVNEFCVAASVVKVEMGIDDKIDLIGTDSFGTEIVDERIAFLDAIDVAEFWCPLGAVAGFDEDVFVLRSNQERVGRQANAVAIVGRRFLLPERFRDHAEHGTAVEIKIAAVQVLDFEFAKVHCYESLSLQSASGEDFVDGGERIFAALGYVGGKLVEGGFSAGGV